MVTKLAAIEDQNTMTNKADEETITVLTAGVPTADTEDKAAAKAATQSALLIDLQDHKCIDPLQYCSYAPSEQYITNPYCLQYSSEPNLYGPCVPF